MTSDTRQEPRKTDIGPDPDAARAAPALAADGNDARLSQKGPLRGKRGLRLPRRFY